MHPSIVDYPLLSRTLYLRITPLQGERASLDNRARSLCQRARLYNLARSPQITFLVLLLEMLPINIQLYTNI